MSNCISLIDETIERNINKYLKDLDIYEEIYSNENVIEVSINPDRAIHVNEIGKGIIKKEGRSDDEKLLNLLKILATLENKQLTDKNPMISIQLILTGGKKVAVVGLIPPVVDNLCISIRKIVQ